MEGVIEPIQGEIGMNIGKLGRVEGGIRLAHVW